MGIFRRAWDKARGTLPLDERIERAIYSLSMQQAKLESISHKTDKAIKETFEKCVSAQMARDHVRASLLATEVAEAKKVAQTVLLSQMAIEQIKLRLQTIKEFGNLVREIGPVAKIARSLRGKLSHIAPGVAFELKDVDNLLSSMLVEAGEVVRTGEIRATHEAEKILEEATMVAEARLKEKFPELPSVGVPERSGANSEIR